jgi:hypothetical protein
LRRVIEGDHGGGLRFCVVLIYRTNRERTQPDTSDGACGYCTQAVSSAPETLGRGVKGALFRRMLLAKRPVAT